MKEVTPTDLVQIGIGFWYKSTINKPVQLARNWKIFSGTELRLQFNALHLRCLEQNEEEFKRIWERIG